MYAYRHTSFKNNKSKAKKKNPKQTKLPPPKKIEKKRHKDEIWGG